MSHVFSLVLPLPIFINVERQPSDEFVIYELSCDIVVIDMEVGQVTDY